MERGMSDYKVLVVDDEPANVYLLKECLEDFNVFSALSVEEMYRLLEEDIPDIILMDIMMPGTDGLTAARDLSLDPRFSNIPVIFISALSSGSAVARGFRTGAQDYIRKPIICEEVIARVVRVLENKTRSDELYRMATRDQLTGLFNRAYFHEQLALAVHRSKRDGIVFSLGIIDIDHFKKVNDTFGHQAGDRVLAGVAQLLAKSFRNSDIIARYGGEEFILIAANSDRHAMFTVLERVRALVAVTELDAEEHISVTISCGIADISEAFSAVDIDFHLIRLADKRLYAAKESGRNMVVSEG